MAYLLEAFGHSVTRARDAEAGLAALHDAEFDIILADVLMPKMDGYTFVRHVKQDRPAAPVIAVTALAMVGDRERILQAGFDGYIAKPIDPETFALELDGYLEPGLRSERLRAHRATNQDPHAPRPATGYSILVVDDVPANIEVVRAAMEMAGHAVTAAGSVRAALEAATTRLPDLVIADIHMPEGSGFDLMREFQADRALANVPFIFLSATSWRASERARALALGAETFLLRPVDPRVLIDEVNQALKSRTR